MEKLETAQSHNDQLTGRIEVDRSAEMIEWWIRWIKRTNKRELKITERKKDGTKSK